MLKTIKAVCFALLVGMVAGFDVTWAQSAANTTAELQAAEDTLGLSRLQRYQIQENLAAGGFNSGRADGVFGRRTREAIRNWQAGQGEDATGYLTEQQARALQEGTAKSAVATTEKQAEDEGETVAKTPAADEGPTVEETIEYLNHKFFECKAISRFRSFPNLRGEMGRYKITSSASTEISGNILIHEFAVESSDDDDFERNAGNVKVNGHLKDEVRMQVDLRHIGTVDFIDGTNHGEPNDLSLGCKSGSCIEAEITETFIVDSWQVSQSGGLLWKHTCCDANPPPNPVETKKERRSNLLLSCSNDAREKIYKALNHLIGKLGTVKELF